MNFLKLLTLCATLCAMSAAFAGDRCAVTSGAATAALVELYTSEGCSSCPPADRQLRDLRGKLDASAVVVPLALHVGYWDQIGWKDVFAQKAFETRQRQLLENRRNKVVYTPQFFVNGDELRDWNAALPAAIRRINGMPAALTITLQTAFQPAPPAPADGVMLTLDAQVDARDPHTSGALALYLALSESALVSHVLRGENGGATFRHDDTVRLWLGPFPLAHGQLRVRQQVHVPPDWRREQVQAVAFVQSSDDGRILQAVSTAQCGLPSPARRL